MTGLERLKQATQIMMTAQGEDATVKLKTLIKLIDLAIEQDK